MSKAVKDWDWMVRPKLRWRSENEDGVESLLFKAVGPGHDMRSATSYRSYVRFSNNASLGEWVQKLREMADSIERFDRGIPEDSK